jgi:hypothetical protein
MNKPSERIVVFVTPAQKRAISATADELGISISELMRRAVLSFGATSEQVKAASIVDRLRAPRQPDALNEALQRVARAGNRMRQATPAALKPASTSASAETSAAPLAPIDLARPVDPVAALAAVDTTEADTDAQAAAARVAAAKAATIASTGASASASGGEPDTRVQSRTATLSTSSRNAKNRRERDQETNDETGIDPAEGTGRFA